MKRKLWIMLAAAVLLAVLWCGIAAADSSGTCGENVTWTLTDAGALTISGTGPMTDYKSSADVPWCSIRTTIKSAVISDGITNIGSWIFAYCTSMESVSIPNSVTSIGSYSLYYCTKLTSVTIPASVTKVGYLAFLDCTSLTSATFLNRSTEIGDDDYDPLYDVFKYCPSDLTIYGFTGSTAQTYASNAGHSFAKPGCGSNLTFDFDASGVLTVSGTGGMTNYMSNTAPWSGFRTSVTSVVIEYGVTSIGWCAFYGCTGLTEVMIPYSVKNIGYMAFMYCSNLTEATVLNSSATIGDTDMDVFVYCGSGFTLRGWSGSTAEYYASHAGHRFANPRCGSKLTCDFNANGVLTVSGTGAMADCYGSSDVPWNGFRTAIKSVVIGNGVKSIGSNAFSSCTNLTEVSFSYGLEEIGSSAFSGCTGLKQLRFPESIRDIKVYAFSECSGLTSVVIPYSVGNIRYKAFSDCTNLADVTILNPGAFIGDTDYDVFGNCASDLTITGWAGSTAETYAAAAGHNFISLGAGSGTCGDNVTWTLNGTASILTISGTGATWGYPSEYPGFYAARGRVQEVIIENGVTEIGSWLFYDMNEVCIVSIPGSVKKISSHAFRKCTSLHNITIPLEVKSIGDMAFNNCTSLTGVKICNTDVTFGDEVFDGCASGLTLRSLAGSAAESFAQENGIAFEADSVPTPAFFLPAGLTSIDAEAFTSIKAKSVVIPKTVTSISGNPFAGSGVQVIYGYAGSAAKALASDYGYYFITITDAWMKSHKP